MFLGACAARRDGPLSISWLALTVVGIFFLEVAKNASGELFDLDSGTDQAVAPEDRSPFSGGKRVLVEGLLTRGQTKAIAAISYLLGILTGLTIVGGRERDVLWVGLAGVACAYFYHAPPFKLSYRGLGELAVAVCYGPLICAGTYLVQRGRISSDVLLVSLPLGLLIAAFLWINEFPDYRADLASGKRTLVVVLGRRRSSRIFASLIATATVLLALLPLAGLPPTVLFGLISLLPAMLASRIALLSPEATASLIPAQALTLVTFLLMALGSGMGMALG
jgi:1,4-dihydroxy-2-naphthoate octaprenyltransferase